VVHGILRGSHGWWLRACDDILPNIGRQRSIVVALKQPDLSDCVLAVSSVQAHHQLRDEMRMLGSIAHSRQGRARSLAFARAGRCVAVGCRMVSITLSSFVTLDLFFQQAQIQVLQGIGF
jgi:hypothetical protein